MNLTSVLRNLVTTGAFLGLTASLQASDIQINSASYNFSGSKRYFSAANSSPMYRNGLGSGYYQPGKVRAKISNYSYSRSGSIVANLWISKFVGATTGKVIYTKGWGGNRNFVFNSRESWTSTKSGYRKILNQYGYCSLGAHEYTGSWPMRDELYFSNSYGKW